MYCDEDYALALQLQEQFATEVGLLYNFYLIPRTSWVGYVTVSNYTGQHTKCIRNQNS
jgi:hypothetical protein